MELSTSYNTLVEKIKSKIQNKDFNFLESEIKIIKLEEELLSAAVLLLKENYNNWATINEKFYKFIDDEALEIYLDDKLIFNYYKYAIDHGKINFAFEESGFLTETQILELQSFFEQKLEDASYKLPIYCVPASIMKIIIDKGRFDLLKSIKGISSLYDETIQKIKNYYLESKEAVSPILCEYLKRMELPIDHLSLQDYISIYNYEDFLPEYLPELMTKIQNETDFSNISFDWNLIFKELSKEQQILLAKTLLDKEYFHTYILKLIDVTDENYEYVVSKILKAIEKGFKVNRMFNYDLTYLFKYNKVLQDSRVISSLIMHGYLSIAVEIPNFKDYEEDVINQVKNNPDKFKDINFTETIALNKYQDLLLELIKSGNQSAMWASNGIDKASIYIKDQALQGKVQDIPYFLMNDNEFVNQLIINGFIDIAFSAFNYLKIDNCLKLNSDSCKMIIERAENDINFAINFLSNHTLIVIYSEQLLNYFLQVNNRFVKIILNKIDHVDENLLNFSETTFEILKEYFAKEYKLNQMHLELFEKNFGPLIIRYINNENIQSFINLPDEQFNKLIALFPKVDLNMVDIEKIYDSLKQYEFSKKYPEVVEIFANINHSLSDNDYKYVDLLNELITVMDEKFYKKIGEIYPELISVIKANPKVFLLVCIKNIKDGTIKEKEKYLEILHTFTNYYIANKREKYREIYQLFEDLTLPYELDLRDVEKQYIKNYLLVSCEDLIADNLSEKGYDRNLILDCINYYRTNNKNFSYERTEEIKQTIKIVIAEAKKLVAITGISQNLVSIMDSENIIKRKYYVENNVKDLYSIIADLRIDILSDTLLKNHQAYDSLLKYMHKYKLHVFPEYFKEIMQTENINISLEPTEISGFISYYEQIYETEKKRLESIGKSEKDINMTIVPIIKYAEAYSSVSNVYNQILGVEDVRLIKANPNPNSAIKYLKGNERLDMSVQYTIENFKRQEITIPAFNEVINFPNNVESGKSLRAIVGNFTHPTNLTHGERTGACMRIGGVGESLFKFCLEDPNGFHIRFEDPKTGEFISRVSGFRNGNSVFLNELRYSCNGDKYSNADLVAVCTKVAEMLIEKSKGSTVPIENVFLHNAYATSGLGMPEVSFNITSNKEGLRKFYSDISDKGIVLATTNKPFAQINFDKTNVPIYKPAREVAYESFDNGKIRNMINRVYAIKECLNGLNYEYLDTVNFENGLLYGIANQDWYVYLDNNGNIHTDYINIDRQAKIELEEAIMLIENKKGELLNKANNEFKESTLKVG